MDCPRCHVALKKTSGTLGMHFGCSLCHGRLVTTPVLRKATSAEAIGALLRRAQEPSTRGAPCPVCHRQMAEVIATPPARGLIDLCTRCQFVWFDFGEWKEDTRPIAAKPPTNFARATFLRETRTNAALAPSHDPQATIGVDDSREAPVPAEAVIEFSTIRSHRADSHRGEAANQHRQSHVPSRYAKKRGPDTQREADETASVFSALSQLAKSPITSSRPVSATPMTWFLTTVTLLVYLKTSRSHDLFVDLLSLSPDDPLRFMGLTFLTAPLIHEGILPLLCGLATLILVGRPCEEAVGSPRLSSVLVMGALIGGGAHLIAGSGQPLIGNAHVMAALIAFFVVRFSATARGWALATVWMIFVTWIGAEALSLLDHTNRVSLPAVLGGSAVGALFAVAIRCRRL